MLSATFIDRPRLSLVISIVIMLAGVIAMYALATCSRSSGRSRPS
jgi:multidrug efflux pump subunit AcrB